MVAKVARITFLDGTKMYAEYSTVSDRVESDLLRVTPQQEQYIEHPETNPDDECYDTDVLMDAMQSINRSVERDEAPDELVQCEILLYPVRPWASTAKRFGNTGIITGPVNSEDYDERRRYGDDMESEAHQMNREWNASKGRKVGVCLKPWMIFETVLRSVVFVLAFAFGMLGLALIVLMRLADSGAHPLVCLGAFCIIGFIGAVPGLHALSAKSRP